MLHTGLNHDPYPQKYLDDHKERIKKAAHERFVREAMKANQVKASHSEPARRLDWLSKLFSGLRNQLPVLKQELQARL